tara:strand:+ start:6340 stop:7548 length:1209 start_codon:yes stop_codon:yes gene_type:complete
MFTYIYFYIGIGFSGLVLFLIAKQTAKRTQNQPGKLPATILTLSFFIWSVGLLEAVLFIPEKSSNLPPPPKILLSYKTNPYVLAKNSILYVMPPKQTYRSFGHIFKTNHLGFREQNFEFQKPTGVFRILVFGSSLTMGVGIDDDHRYSNLLNEMLKKKYPKKNIEVLNFGMAAYNYDQEHDLIAAILKKIKCNLIVLGIPGDLLKMTTKSALVKFTNVGLARSSIDLNQFDPFRLLSNSNRNLATIPDAEPEEFYRHPKWYKNLRLFNAIENRTQINSDKFIPNANRLNYLVNEWRGIIKLLKARNLPPPIASLLYRGTVDPRRNDFINPVGDLSKNIRLLKFLGKKLRQEGFHIVDPLPLFEQYSGMSMAISEWEMHPNYLAHYIYAKSLFETLTINNWIR